MAQAGRCVAYEFEGPNGKVSPTTLENHSRALSRFLIAFCSGVAATLAWWSYGDAARQMIARSYPQLGSSAPPPAQTASEAPDMIVPDPNQLDATMRQSLDRIVAGQEKHVVRAEIELFRPQRPGRQRQHGGAENGLLGSLTCSGH
jgi:hypothetical protein